VAAGEVLDTLKSEAEALTEWLARNHSGLAQMSRKTVENCIRRPYQAWKAVK
jgi:hypothetical protein